MLRHLDLLEKPGAFYATAGDSVKRRLLRAYFADIWIDVDGHQPMPGTQQQTVVTQIIAASHRSATHENDTEQLLGAADSSPLTLFFQRVGSSRREALLSTEAEGPRRLARDSRKCHSINETSVVRSPAMTHSTCVIAENVRVGRAYRRRDIQPRSTTMPSSPTPTTSVRRLITNCSDR